MRNVIRLTVEGMPLNGTCHLPERWPLSGGERAVGILFSNFGYTPRSGRGDFAAYLADSMTLQGFASFRFDMPGLGDSAGEVPHEVLPFYEMVQEGHYVKYISGLRTQLVRRYGLSGMIYLGHCGSATTAVYAAQQDRSPDLIGLILLEPSFVWYRPLSKADRRFRERRSRLHDWLSRVHGGEAMIVAYGFLKRCYASMQRTRLPASANRNILIAYNELFSRRFPMLVLTASSVKHNNAAFDYLGYLSRRGCPSSLKHVEISGTDHAFVKGDGKVAALHQIETWVLQELFPYLASKGHEST
jgi:hypothetical protein